MGSLGLPQSAWQNNATYAATAYPENPRVGDRVLRTDFGSGGIWMNYVLVGSTNFWVPDPGQRLVKLRQHTTAQTIPNDTDSAITFNGEDYDVFGFHSTSVNTSRVTPNFPGHFTVAGSVSLAADADGHRTTKWAKNGNVLDGSSGRGLGNSGFLSKTLAQTFDIECNGSTDYFQLFFRHTAGGDTDTNVGTENQSSMLVIYAGL